MELQQLKDIASKVGYTYHHMTGAEKLEKGLREYCAEVGTTIEDVAKDLGIEIGQPELTTSSTEVNIPSKGTPLSKAESKEDYISRLSKLTFKDAEADKNKKDAATRTKEAMRLIRCILTTNNKNKSQYVGEIFAVRNAKIPEVKKMVPFNVPTHIPQILLNMIREKQYQTFQSKKLPDGNTIKLTRMIPEYNIQLLDPLSKEELEAIKQKQLAEGFNGE